MQFQIVSPLVDLSQSFCTLLRGCRQLPPATSQAPFIKLESVHNGLDFRVLRQNRRVVKGDADTTAQRKAEIENFHGDPLSRRMCLAMLWHTRGSESCYFMRACLAKACSWTCRWASPARKFDVFWSKRMSEEALTVARLRTRSSRAVRRCTRVSCWACSLRASQASPRFRITRRSSLGVYKTPLPGQME